MKYTCGNDKKIKVIYAGFPMRLCENCNAAEGFWTWILRLHFNGEFMTYEGSYITALWHWLKGGHDE